MEHLREQLSARVLCPHPPQGPQALESSAHHTAPYPLPLHWAQESMPDIDKVPSWVQFTSSSQLVPDP